MDAIQFGFMKGKGTTCHFTLRQMPENFRVKGKKLYFGFVDLEKAFDRFPREVIRWAMHKLGVEEWLVSAGLCTQVKKQLSRGRPKRTRREVAQKDCQAHKLNREDAMDRSRWKKLIKIG